MKTFAAILGSVLLLWAQCASGFAPALAFPAADDANACACADCRGACCCVNAPDSNSPLTPVAPPSGSAHEIAALLIPSALAWQTPDSGGRDEFAPAHASPSLAAVPLFTRDCARLL